MSGALLYIYAGGTTTPSSIYEDFGLTTTVSNPLEADSSGRIPQFWLADGSYDVRLTDSSGNEIFYLHSTSAIGASSGASSGGTVSDASIFQTGDPLWLPINGTRSGWVRGNARTIGNSSSAATERANADTQTLFEYFWNNFSNTLCPVSTGRGLTATADFNASKTIGTLDMRGRTAYGMDTMGNSAASIIATATSAAGALGQETKALVQANVPSYNLVSSSLTATPTLTVSGTISGGSVVSNTVNVNIQDTGSGQTVIESLTLAAGTYSTSVAGTIAVGGTVPSGGSGTALATLSPGRAGTWYFRL